ncbi:MAG: site-specific DNA-methyltransferase [Treponemataceae bacterium]|nr:site-specific DNA-methyltransferase [Treponemataceae bacterium]
MSINLSKQKREDLLNKIEQIRLFLNHSLYDENTRKLSGYLNELSTEINGQKYGLVFEEHKEGIDYTLENNLPVLTEEKELFVNNGGEINFLIEGDNLASLQLLEKTHRGKIDVIYIDPPYNTGNKDFIYDDDFVDSADSFRHSKWLSFMEKRLRIAKDLLNEKGVIFISIDDNEQASAKILSEEIFGENNFIGQLTWESTTQPINAGKARFQLQQKVEYILCYAKNKNQKDDFILKESDSNLQYPHMGKFGACRFEIIEKSDAGAYQRDTMKYQILGQFPREGKRWQIGEDTARKLEKAGKIEIVDGIVKKAVYPEDEIEKIKYIPFWSHFSSADVGTAQNGKDELNFVFDSAVGFDTVKPVRLITELLGHFHNTATILDFFAGSGTTGHAVIKLNSEDGGHRKFILCTNNENSICRDITYQRLKTVITGKRKDGSTYSDGLSGSLKYFKVDFVEITEKEYYEYADKLLLHVRELVELENAVNFEGNSKIAIVLTEEELESFFTNYSDDVKTLYLGHDVLLSKEQKIILEKYGIEVKIIPQYYYPELNG